MVTYWWTYPGLADGVRITIVLAGMILWVMGAELEAVKFVVPS